MARTVQASKSKSGKSKAPAEKKVESILDHRFTGHGKRFLIHWTEDEYADSWAWDDEIKHLGGEKILKRYMDINRLNSPDEDSPEVETTEQQSESGVQSTESNTEETDNEYEVEKIISHRIASYGYVYTVTWVGYPGEVSEMSEMDLENSKELLDEYKKKHNIGRGSARRSRMSDTDPKEAVTRETQRSTKKRHSISTDSGSSIQEILVTPRTRVRGVFGTTTRSRKSSTPEVLKTPLSKKSGIGKTTKYSLRTKNRDSEDSTFSSEVLQTSVARSTRSATKKEASKREKENEVFAETPVTKKKKMEASENTKSKNNGNRTSIVETTHPIMDPDPLLAEQAEAEPDRDSPQVSSRRSFSFCTMQIPKNYSQMGIFNGLEVSHMSNLKFRDDLFNGSTTIKVHYKEPVPVGFNSSEFAPVSAVRYLAPQQLLDHYESLLNV